MFFCVVVIGTWCLGGIRGQREAYLGRKPVVQVPDILPCEGKGCVCYEEWSISRLQILEYYHRSPFPKLKPLKLQIPIFLYLSP